MTVRISSLEGIDEDLKNLPQEMFDIKDIALLQICRHLAAISKSLKHMNFEYDETNG